MNKMVNYDTIFALSPAPLIIFDLSTEESSSTCGWNAQLKDANPAALELYEAASVQEFADSIPVIIGDEGPATLEKLCYFLAAGERRFRVETTNRTVKGELLRDAARKGTRKRRGCSRLLQHHGLSQGYYRGKKTDGKAACAFGTPRGESQHCNNNAVRKQNSISQSCRQSLAPAARTLRLRGYQKPAARRV